MINIHVHAVLTVQSRTENLGRVLVKYSEISAFKLVDRTGRRERIEQEELRRRSIVVRVCVCVSVYCQVFIFALTSCLKLYEKRGEERKKKKKTAHDNPILSVSREL